MARTIFAGLFGAAFVATILLIMRATQPAAPPSSVVVNYQPYPTEKPATGHPDAPKKAPAAKPAPAGPIQSVKKPGKTWKRVVIIDGRKCYQPMGGGPITARYCE